MNAFGENIMRAEDESRKSERLAVRLSTANKHLLEQAATVQGSTLTEFVVRSAMAAARTTLAEAERIVLCAEDRDTFLAALDSPPTPNAALRAAAKRHRKLAS